MWTFRTKPIPMKQEIAEDPPYETNGIGIPVIGIIPKVIPTD